MKNLILLAFLLCLAACDGGSSSKPNPGSGGEDVPNTLGKTCNAVSAAEAKSFVKSLESKKLNIQTNCDDKSASQLVVAVAVGAALNSTFGDSYPKKLDAEAILNLNSKLFDFRTCSIGTISEKEVLDTLQNCKSTKL